VLIPPHVKPHLLEYLAMHMKDLANNDFSECEVKSVQGFHEVILKYRTLWQKNFEQFFVQRVNDVFDNPTPPPTFDIVHFR